MEVYCCPRMCLVTIGFLRNQTPQSPSISTLTREGFMCPFVPINPLIITLQPFSTRAEKCWKNGGFAPLCQKGRGAFSRSQGSPLKKAKACSRCGVRGQLRSPFKTSVSWKTLLGLPPCSSGLFRNHLDIEGEILQLLLALGGPVTKAYSSHLGCLHARWGKTGSPGGPCLGHSWQDGMTHPQPSARISPRAKEGVMLPSDVTCTRSPRMRWLGHSPLSSNMDKRHGEKMKHSCPRRCVSPSSPGLGESRIGSASLHMCPVLLLVPAHLLLETRCQAEGKLPSQLFISSVLALLFAPCKSSATRFSDFFFSFLHLVFQPILVKYGFM